MKNIKIFTYNTCYGLKANSLYDAYNATWRIVHKRKNPQEILEKSNFDEVFEMVENENPDVVVLNEIFDDLQTKPVIRKLKSLGYNYISIGNSGHHDKPILVSTLIASKTKYKDIKTPFVFEKGVPGTGGGAVGIYFKEIDLFILGFHTAFKQDFLIPQLKEIDSFYEEIKGKYENIIFVGDFNRDFSFYKNNSMAIREFNFVQNKSTFPSFIPWYKPFKIFSNDIVTGQIDNIFYKGNLSVLSSKVIDKKRSDHKPLIAELEIK